MPVELNHPDYCLKVTSETNLAIIKRIKEKAGQGHFSIGEIAKEFNVPFQKDRHFCHAITANDGKSMLKTARGEWVIE